MYLCTNLLPEGTVTHSTPPLTDHKVTTRHGRIHGNLQRKALRATGCELSFWHHTYVHALQVSEPASLGLHAVHACIREWNEAAGSTTPQSHALSYEWNQIWFLWNWIRIAFLSYFYSSTNTNSGVLGYEHKKDTSDSIHIRIFNRFRRYCLSIFFVGRFRTTKSSYK